MRLWRICRQPRVASALSGEGGLFVSGRWHTVGRPVVYTATHPALAALEVLVHTDPACAPVDLRLLTVEVPDDLGVAELDLAALPTGWDDLPVSPVSQHLGDRWLAAVHAALLRVPSAVMPQVTNVLINPRHPDASRCRIVDDEPFRFDRRLVRV